MVNDMAAEDVRIAEKNSTRPSHLSSDQVSRLLILGVQIIGDGLILTASSCASLIFIMYPDQIQKQQYVLYGTLTIATTAFLITRFMKWRVYDIFDEFHATIILKTTAKCLFKAILMLTACFFLFRIGDRVSRLWLASWSITSVIAIC